ncbi:MAG: adenylate/guanylate cyclase domain-containing protein, partial [Pirellulales bacterium]
AEVQVGRDCDPWSVSWDPHISRQHARLICRGERVDVQLLPGARNPLFHRGRAVTSCTLRGGESFVIGSTTFTFEHSAIDFAPGGAQPVERRAFDSHALRSQRFVYTSERLDMLTRLPELLADVVSEDDWVVQLVSLVLAGVPRADAAALVVTDESGHGVTLRHWDRRGPATPEHVFAPRAALIHQATASRATVLHAWNAEGGAWAYCTPLPGQASRGWALYVAGESSGGAATERPRPDSSPATAPSLDSTVPAAHAALLEDDVKFTELLAATAGRLRDTQRLLRRQAGLRPFFSPVVLEALGERDPDEVLAPREIAAAVLFCDLRGFSRAAERQAHDLHGLLRRVSDALGAMTRHILATGGVIGDFHGDAAMGFWGWPLPQPDAAERACRAALAIRGEFAAAAQRPDHPLAGFQVGLGLATGSAVAGKIGSSDQVKVTAFGPVVNRAARLETLTKRLGAPILLDGPTARAAADTLPSTVARVRRIVPIRPRGFASVVDVCELIDVTDPAAACPSSLQQQHWEQIITAFLTGDWPRASALLAELTPHDRVARFLQSYLRERDSRPPLDWTGSIDVD